MLGQISLNLTDIILILERYLFRLERDISPIGGRKIAFNALCVWFFQTSCQMFSELAIEVTSWSDGPHRFRLSYRGLFSAE